MLVMCLPNNRAGPVTDMRRLPRLSFSLFFYLSFLSRYRADQDEPPCFMIPASKCAELKSGDKCGLSGDQFSEQIYCCNVTHDRELTSYFDTLSSPERPILGFHMRDSSLDKLEIAIFDKLKKLSSFSITGSNITYISGSFDGHSSLTCLNISQNMILEMYPYVLLKLKGLKNIVITNNKNVTVLPEFSSELKGFKLDVSDNDKLSCKYLINLTLAIAQDTLKFTHINKNSTKCLPPNSRVFTDPPVYVNMDHLDKVKEIVYNCPTINNTDKCHCSVYTLDVGEDRELVYQALVNCSHKAMTSLPDKLPSATRVLDISHNNITSFDGIGNERFNNIRELYADNNKITSLKPLEGTKFLYQFQNLTLKNNKIDQISVYMLSNVFDRLQGTRILLAKNEIKCDCQTASYFKGWLMTNKDNIPDYYDIYTACETSKIRVIDLNHEDVCSNTEVWNVIIRYVICGEIIVFVFLIVKVSYDYYIFKTFGYLPWPASRMPKLPCDWCFET